MQILQGEMDKMKLELDAEQMRLNSLQEEHQKLLKQKEVLQAELQLALNNYQPKAIIDAGMDCT